MAQQSQFYTHTLSNGLQIVGERMPDVESVAVGYYIMTGGRDEEPAEDGLSHFLEHMLFKGTTTGLDAATINLEFHRIGANVNAYTDREQTVYFAQVLYDDAYDRAFALLSDMVIHPKLATEDFEMERNVILEEIARYDDLPEFLALYQEIYTTYFNDHPLDATVLGSRDSIAGMAVDTMRGYWQRRYVPNNAILGVAGKFDWEHVVRLAEERCGGWQPRKAGRILHTAQPQSCLRVISRANLNQQIVVVAAPSATLQDDKRTIYAAQVLATILGDESGSRLYWKLLHTGLVESTAAYSEQLDGAGVLIAYANTAPELAGQVLRVLQDELARLADGDISAEELERARNKLITGIVRQRESSFNNMQTLFYNWIARRQLESLDDAIATIEAITVDDLAALVQRYSPAATQVSLAFGPLSEDELQAQRTTGSAVLA